MSPEDPAKRELTPDELVMEYAPYVAAYPHRDMTFLLNPKTMQDERVIAWLDSIKQTVIEEGLEEKGRQLIEARRAIKEITQQGRHIIDAACIIEEEEPQFDLNAWNPDRYDDMHEQENPRFIDLAEWEHPSTTDDGVEMKNSPRIPQESDMFADNLKFEDPKTLDLETWDPNLDDYVNMN